MPSGTLMKGRCHIHYQGLCPRTTKSPLYSQTNSINVQVGESILNHFNIYAHGSMEPK